MFAIILNWITSSKFLLILIFTSAETNTKACSKLVVVDSEMSRSVNVQVELCVHRLCTNGIRNIRAISTWMVEHQSSVVRCTHRFLQLLDSCCNCFPSHFQNSSQCRRHTEFGDFQVRACIQFVGFIQFPLIR